MKKEGPGLPSTERATSSPIRALSSSGGPRWKGRQVLGDSNVAAGKFFFGVNRGPTPLASDFGSTLSTYQQPHRPREQCLESWPLANSRLFWDDFLAAVVTTFS